MYEAEASGEGWLEDWPYRKSHFIQNRTGAGTGYQIQLMVHRESWWTEKAQMTYARQYGAMGVVNGKLYVIGGRASANDGDAGTRYAYNEEYDPATGNWTTKTAIPTAFDAASCVVYDNKIWVAGGFSNGQKHYMYDPAGDNWTDSPTDLPVPRWDTGSALINQYFYVIGGSSDGNAFTTLYYLDLENPTGAWDTNATSSYAHAKVATSVHEGKIYAFTSNWYTINKKVERYDPQTDSWETLGDAPYAFQAATPTSIGGYIYLLKSSAGSYNTPNTYRYDPENDTYTLLANLDIVESLSSTLILPNIGNSIYHCGGSSPVNYKTDRVFMLNLSATPNPTEPADHAYLGHDVDEGFGDLRFTDNDGETLLDYWIEPQSSNSCATVWVKIADDLSSANVTIYLYYGNTGQNTTSNMDATFPILSDDFEDGTDGQTPTGWNDLSEESGDIFEVDTAQSKHGDKSVLLAEGGGTTNGKARTDDLNGYSSCVLHYWFRGDSSNEYDARSVHYVLNETDTGTIAGIMPRDDGVWRGTWSPGWGDIPNWGEVELDTWLRIEWYLKDGQVRWVKDRREDSGWLDAMRNWTSMDYVQLGTAYAYPGGGWFDDIYIRKYVYPEPAPGASGTEETEPAGDGGNNGPIIDSYSISATEIMVTETALIEVTVTDLDLLSNISYVYVKIFDFSSAPYDSSDTIHFQYNVADQTWTEENDPYDIGNLLIQDCTRTDVDADTMTLKFFFIIEDFPQDAMMDVSMKVWDGMAAHEVSVENWFRLYPKPRSDGSSSDGSSSTGQWWTPPEGSPADEIGEIVAERTEEVNDFLYGEGGVFGSGGAYESLYDFSGGPAGFLPAPEIVKPWMQRYGAWLITLLIILAFLYAIIRQQSKGSEGPLDERSLGQPIQVNLEPIVLPTKGKEGDLLKWVIVVGIIVFLLVVTPVGDYVKELWGGL